MDAPVNLTTPPSRRGHFRTLFGQLSARTPLSAHCPPQHTKPLHTNGYQPGHPCPDTNTLPPVRTHTGGIRPCVRVRGVRRHWTTTSHTPKKGGGHRYPHHPTSPTNLRNTPPEGHHNMRGTTTSRRHKKPHPAYRGPWPRIRAGILARDNNRCQIQGPTCTVTATAVDHIQPLSQGGAWWDPANLQAACVNCNNRKRHTTPDTPTTATTTTQPSRTW